MEYIGTKLKYVARSSGDFSITDHEWKAVFTCGSNSVTFTKKNVDGGGAWQLSCDQPGMGVKPRSDGSWVFLIDTAVLGAGRIIAKFYPGIPDTDFNPDSTFSDLDGQRCEVKRFSLITIMKP